jgi:hypothetical protein
MEMQVPQNNQNILKKNKIGRVTFLNINVLQNSTIIKTMWYWHKDRQIYQCNGIKSPEIGPYVYDFREWCQDNPVEKRTVFSSNLLK